MTERKFAFTDERLRKTWPRGQRTRVYDTKQPGLALRVTATVSKTFKFVAWDSTRAVPLRQPSGLTPRSPLLTPAVSPRNWQSRMAMGEDIVGQSQAERAEPTLDQAFDRWVAKKAGPRAHQLDHGPVAIRQAHQAPLRQQEGRRHKHQTSRGLVPWVAQGNRIVHHLGQQVFGHHPHNLQSGTADIRQPMRRRCHEPGGEP